MNADEQAESLVEGIDYYIENGLYVFTAYYLEKRGYCCKNGCRHCPYGFEKLSNQDLNEIKQREEK